MLCHKFKSYFHKKYFKSIPSPWDVQHFPTAIASGHLQGQLWVLPVHPVGFSRISIHESLEISWDVQVCYRLADPKCQCLSCSALAIYKLFQEITKASPALRQGWNPRLGTERWHLKNRWQKTMPPWNSSFFDSFSNEALFWRFVWNNLWAKKSFFVSPISSSWITTARWRSGEENTASFF